MPKGLMIGPVSGKLLAQLIDGEVSDVDLMLFDPARCFRRLGRRRRARLAARAVGSAELLHKLAPDWPGSARPYRRANLPG